MTPALHATTSPALDRPPPSTATQPSCRVAVVCDLREERWHSMDLVADMLVEQLASVESEPVQATALRPRLVPRVQRLARSAAVAHVVDRVVNRFWDYPRWLRSNREPFDVFHVVDHTYAHLVHELPAARTVVSCHDIDAFRSVTHPGRGESRLPRRLVHRTLSGLQRAAVVVCGSSATRRELVRHGLVGEDRLVIVPYGVHPSCTPEPCQDADEQARAMLGPDSRFVELLHVGSTVARKRLDRVLHTTAAVRQAIPGVRLVRVGGELERDQRRLAARLGIDDSIVTVPFVDRQILAAIYRRAALVLLPSEREGFGLPVVEALACGTPVIASDLDVLREVGGDAATYIAGDDGDGWISAVTSLLAERAERPADRGRRVARGLDRARRFSWADHARAMTEIYHALA